MKLIFAFLIPFALTAQKNCEVVIHSLGDPDRLNPLTSSAANATYIQNQVFSRLLEYDQQTLELKPQLAVALPVVEILSTGEYAGGMSLTYEIHPEAKWDNGKPVTATDYIFTIKALKNPLVNSAVTRPYYNFVDEIKVDANNPKKFTIYSKKPYFLATAASGDFLVMPEYIYDKKQVMRGFSIPQLNDPKNEKKLQNSAQLKAFADSFHSIEYDRETVVGSGAYRFVKWELGDKIVLERKPDWWGYKAALEAYPDKLIYKIIVDMATANVALAQGEVDVVMGIKPEAYRELQADESLKDMLSLSAPPQFAYYYIGFNMMNEKLSDPALRLALAHLVNREEIINEVFDSLATKTNSPINPSKPYYHKELPDIEFSVDKAKEILSEAGWADSDADGILDKKIEGKKVDLKLTYAYNQGNSIRKNIGLLLQNKARLVGIEIEIIAREWTVFLDDIKRRDFELVCLAWVQGLGLDDLKQIWHTESNTPDGSNRTGFGNKESDAIIDEIRQTMDEQKRNELYLKIQQMIYDAHPYIFICVPSERIAINKRFKNAETSALRPGFQPHLFKCE